MQTPSRSCSSSRGCSWWRAPPWRRRRSGGGRPGRADGWRTRSPAAASRRCRPTRPARRRRRRSGRCSGRPRRRRARPPSATPAPGPELVAVQAQTEPGGPPRLEHRAALLGVEGPALAEHVDPAAPRRAGVEHRPADELDVVVGVDRPSRPGRRGRRGRCLVGHLLRHGEQPGLGRDVQPVPALDLDGRRAARAGPRRRGAGRRRADLPRAPRGSPRRWYGSRRPRRAAPAIRAANSADRSPAKTRCVWLSTKPGITARPPASHADPTRLRRQGRLGPDPFHGPVPGAHAAPPAHPRPGRRQRW